MNTFWNTPVHLVTLVFIVLELMLLCYQLFHFLSRPQDRQRLWYLLLLFLLVHYNVWNGLFPDPRLGISLKLQYMVAYGMAFLMGAYFLFYFYEAFGLRGLRFHVVYGIPCFLLIPFLAFLFLYWRNDELTLDKKIVAVIPLVYGLVVLAAMYKAIRQQFRVMKDKRHYCEQLSVWMAMLPWQGMAVFAVYPNHQDLKIIMANLSLVVITFFLMANAIRQNRREYHHLSRLDGNSDLATVIAVNGERYRLTKRQVEIVLLLNKGYTYKAIADQLFISEKTVNNHIQNIYEKTRVGNKMELIQKLSGLGT